jgi:hypothetical protein
VKTRGRMAIGAALGLYLVVLGALMGAAVERIRFDRQRSQVLARYDQAVRAWHTHLMTLETLQ